MDETPAQRHDRQQQVALAAIPQLNALADEVEAITSAVSGKRIEFSPDDGADVMTLSFVTKQREHFRSVRLLVESTQHRDALLIARTMIEGMGRLLWAYNRPERTELWLWFGAILDWRRTLKNEADGLFVDPTDKAELKRLVDLHGPNYYKPNVRRAMKDAEDAGTEYEFPPDPWDNNWTTTSVRSMFAEVSGERMYDISYRLSSEWVHWGPRAIFSAMEPSEWGFSGFSQQDWRSAAEALVLGCQSVLQSLEVLDQHFSLGLADRLEELMTRIEAIFKASIADQGEEAQTP